ncbi:type II secretion system protein [Pyxidicoccus xibeiensis]|uniref:type II secretion system protein n=1 Tax=Pyxidicoccus xibeiensis TaxID=2906759 RepID=UPI0020A731F5|nr:type II secretion system protein [Pyxidicoccus xibeiensis]MCP3136537.1 hypothetical protein [Pyxidicoccus xibeiensis]
MVVRPSSRRRKSGGFTLLVAMGVVTLMTMAVLLSYGVVSREAGTQGDSRRRKEAFFAAEAGMAEGREAMRLRLGDRQTYGNVLTTLGAAVNEPGLAGANPPWFEVLPGAEPDGWNYLRLVQESLTAAELSSESGTPYVEYPTQDNVRYRVFVRDDLDDTNPNTDTNGQVWLMAVGEVLNTEGRPTRSIVQALITNENAPAAGGPGCVNRGCGPDNTFNNSQDPRSPDTTLVRSFR